MAKSSFMKLMGTPSLLTAIRHTNPSVGVKVERIGKHEASKGSRSKAIQKRRVRAKMASKSRKENR